MELALGAGLLLFLLWLGWRRPTWLFLLAIAALAIRPQLLWGGAPVGYEWSFHQTLLAFALATNALHFGIRRTPNWPILALLVTFCLSIALGNLQPKLTFPFMLESLAILALPFVFAQVVLEPGSRRAYALVIMLTPLLSVALGLVLQTAELRSLFARTWGGEYRLEGAAGNGPVFATLAFAGLVVGLHEATRRGRWYAGPVAAVNFAMVVLSATRMAVFASGLYVVAYVVLSSDLRTKLRTHLTIAAVALAIGVSTLILYWPTLEARMFAETTGALRLSGRDDLWSFYYQDLLRSPIVGRGVGAGFLAAEDWFSGPLPTPHNEYLHLLVIGGITGFIMMIIAVVAWYRKLYLTASPNDQVCLLALIPALAAYGATDNLSFYSSALALYAYFGVLLTQPSPVPRDATVATVARDLAPKARAETLSELRDAVVPDLPTPR